MKKDERKLQVKNFELSQVQLANSGFHAAMTVLLSEVRPALDNLSRRVMPGEKIVISMAIVSADTHVEVEKVEFTGLQISETSFAKKDESNDPIAAPKGASMVYCEKRDRLVPVEGTLDDVEEDGEEEASEDVTDDPFEDIEDLTDGDDDTEEDGEEDGIDGTTDHSTDEGDSDGQGGDEREAGTKRGTLTLKPAEASETRLNDNDDVSSKE